MHPLPTEQELLDLHDYVVRFAGASGDPIVFVGEREPGLVSAAVARPEASFAGRDLYRSERERIAALIHAINASHVFRDGNKRTSTVVLVFTLDRGGWRLDCSDDELVDFIVAIASGEPPYAGPDAVVEVTSWIRAHTHKKRDEIGALRTEEFLRRVEAAGGRISDSGTSWVVRGERGSVRFSKSTRELAEAVIRRYLSDVGLSEAWTGLAPDEFADGTFPGQHLISQYRGVLYRLAEYDREQDEESQR